MLHTIYAVKQKILSFTLTWLFLKFLDIRNACYVAHVL